MSSKLSVVDDPLRKRGLGAHPFDDEGLTARPLSVIKEGVLENVYIDTYYGKKLGMPVTTGDPSSRVLALGTQSGEEMERQVADGVVVQGWLGGNMDSTTGDFSFGARGHLIENGTRTTSVAEMNVTGNIRDLFAKLTHVGNDPYPYASSVIPSLAFDGVHFSGR